MKIHYNLITKYAVSISLDVLGFQLLSKQPGDYISSSLASNWVEYRLYYIAMFR